MKFTAFLKAVLGTNNNLSSDAFIQVLVSQGVTTEQELAIWIAKRASEARLEKYPNLEAQFVRANIRNLLRAV